MSNNRVVIPSNKYPCDTFGELRRNEVDSALQVYKHMELQPIRDEIYYDIKRYFTRSYKYVSYNTAFKVSNTVFKKLNSDFFYTNGVDEVKHMDKALLFVTCPDYADIITNYSKKFYGAILKYSKTQHMLIYPITIIENIYLSSEAKNAKDIFKDELRVYMKRLEDVGATLIKLDYFENYIKDYLPKGPLNTATYPYFKSITTFLETDLVKYGSDFNKKIQDEYIPKGGTSLQSMWHISLKYEARQASFNNDITKYINDNLIRNGGALVRDKTYYSKINSVKEIYDSMNLVLLDMLQLRNDVTTKLQDVYNTKFNVGYNVTKTFKNIIDDFTAADDLYDSTIADRNAYNTTMLTMLPYANGFDISTYPNWKAITNVYEKALQTLNDSLSLYQSEAGKATWDIMVSKSLVNASAIASAIESLRLHMIDILEASKLLWAQGTYSGTADDLGALINTLSNLVNAIKVDIEMITSGPTSTLPKLTPAELYAVNNPTSLDAYNMMQNGTYDSLIAYNTNVTELKPTVDAFKSKIDIINFYYNKVYNETNGLIKTDQYLMNYSFLW